MEEYDYKFVLYMGFLCIQMVTVKATSYDEAEYKLWDYLTEEKLNPIAIDLIYEEDVTYV